MMHAIEQPATRLATAVAAAGLVCVLALAATRQDTVVRRLVLTAPVQANALYLTAWHRGDVLVRVPSGDPQPLTFEVRARVSDGCEWLATEQLVPTGGNVYAYRYDEVIVSCEPDARPSMTTPRTGIVVSVAP